MPDLFNSLNAVTGIKYYLQIDDPASAHYIARKYFPNEDPITLMEQWADDQTNFTSTNDYASIPDRY